jgi:hypothetical protein
MSKKTLRTIADFLNSVADGMVTVIEIIISDHAGKRPRRSHRVITQRVYHRPPRQVVYRVYNQRVIVRGQRP